MTSPDAERIRFEDFFEQHYRRLFQASLLLCGNTAEADDLTQESFARLFERWERVSRMASPEGYLFQTAMNLHRSRLRRMVRRAGRAFPAPPAADATEQAATRLDALQAIGTLPLGERQAVVLVDWLGWDAAEAGRVLGIKPVSVRSRLHRGRERLRVTMGDADE